LSNTAMDKSQSLWRKLSATKNLADLGKEYKSQVENTTDVSNKSRMQQFSNEIDGIITKIKMRETNPQLIEIYEQF